MHMGYWTYIEEIFKKQYANMEVHADKCMGSEVCELFALTDRTVAWSMLEIPQVKQNKNME